MVKFLLPITLFFLMFSCTTRFSSQTSRYTQEKEGELKSKLTAVSRTWLNTPYQFGGTTRNGIDCSALVQNIYRQAFELRLPRTTAEQMSSGIYVSQRRLKPGDLLFFGNRRRGVVDHVGIYLGEQKFIHVSTEQGVIISDISSPYYKRRFITARRYLP